MPTAEVYKELQGQIKTELDTISSLADNIISELPLGSGAHLAIKEIGGSISKINELLEQKKG